jgi:hypothetical protein
MQNQATLHDKKTPASTDIKESFPLRLFSIIAVAAFFSLTLFFFGPLQIYFTNTVEFTFSLHEILPYLIILSLFVILFISVTLLFLRGSAYEKVFSLVFILSLLLWLQGNLIVWKYGQLKTDIPWGELWYYGVIDGLIWISFIAFAIRKSDLIKRIAWKISIALILIQLVAISSIGKAKKTEPYSFYDYSIVNDDKFNFSSEKNIIILLLDTFQSDVFQEIIDEDASYTDMFDGFTFFRNALGGFSTTYPSVMNILTGNYYDNTTPVQESIKNAFLSDSSLPKKLKESGIVVELYPLVKQSIYYDEDVLSNIRSKKAARKRLSAISVELAYLIDITMFRHAPHFLKKHIINRYNWLLKPRVASLKAYMDKKDKEKEKESVFSEVSVKKLMDIRFVDMMLKSFELNNSDPVFKFYHLMGLHAPLKMNENLEYEELGYAKRGDFIRTGKGALKYLKIFLNKLKEEEAYDNSMILIVADHGNPYGDEKDIGVKVPEYLATGKTNEKENLPDVKSAALPLVLVKRIGSKGEMKYSDAPVSLSDIPKTVLNALSINSDNVTGRSMYDIKENENRERNIYFFTWKARDNAYLNTLYEYSVSGHSWLDESWTKTGKVFEPAETEEEVFFRKIKGDNKYISAHEYYSSSDGKVNSDLKGISFYTPDPVKGDYIGVKIAINGLNKGDDYKVSLDVSDSYGFSFPSRFEQRVLLGDKLAFKHDLAGADEFIGWNKVEYVFTADSESTELRAELKVTGNPEKGWKWGKSAKIAIRNVKVSRMGGE